MSKTNFREASGSDLSEFIYTWVSGGRLTEEGSWSGVCRRLWLGTQCFGYSLLRNKILQNLAA